MVISLFFVHQVSVQDFQGSGAFGDIFGSSRTVACFVEHKRRIVRDTMKAEVVSETTFFASVDETVPVGSKVTFPDGSTSRVIASIKHTAPGLPLPVHLEVNCE